MKILGVTFSSKSPAGELKDNWENIVENIERTLGAWSKRDLSLIGKNLILKTFALSKLNHLKESIGLPNTVLKHLNTMFFRFLWKKRYDYKRAFEKIKRKVMYNATEKGGLKILNIEAIQSAAYLHWAKKKLLTGVEQDWKILAKAAYKNVGFPAVFASTVKPIRGIESVENKFWKKVLETWTTLNNDNDTKVKLTQPIFNNKLLIYQGTPLFNKQCILSNILWVKDLFINDRFMTREEFNNTVGAGARNFMTYNLLRTVVLNKVNRNDRLDNCDQEPQIPFQDNTLGNFKRQGFLKQISTIETPSAQNFWSRKFQMSVPKDIWSIPWRTTKETRLRALQFRILHNIHPTNILLEKMGIAPNSLCQIC